MSSPFDESDFIDHDFQSRENPPVRPAPGGTSSPTPSRPPSQAELDTRVTEAQHRLAELKRAQENLERERSALEEARRRRAEWQTGREEMLHHLTRGIGLLEEAESSARREAEQMARTLAELREALLKVQSIREETWDQDSWNVELTRALTTLENARMEWNAARLKWSVLQGEGRSSAMSQPSGASPVHQLLKEYSVPDLCKIGLALTWPLALVSMLSLIIFLFLVLNK